ncbi:hypothetical protein C8J57DRAFT_1234767 [Mycena rebaudengoi]|nr:hypothetical protein C8J57DRAFT_1234767 [Mycena rebaudengoi]
MRGEIEGEEWEDGMGEDDQRAKTQRSEGTQPTPQEDTKKNSQLDDLCRAQARAGARRVAAQALAVSEHAQARRPRQSRELKAKRAARALREGGGSEVFDATGVEKIQGRRGCMGRRRTMTRGGGWACRTAGGQTKKWARDIYVPGVRRGGRSKRIEEMKSEEKELTSRHTISCGHSPIDSPFPPPSPPTPLAPAPRRTQPHNSEIAPCSPCSATTRRARHAVRGVRHARETRAVRCRRQVQHTPPGAWSWLPGVRSRVDGEVVQHVVCAVPDEVEGEPQGGAFARERGLDFPGDGEVGDEGGGEEKVIEERQVEGGARG